jgi:hypothetical protein
MADDSTPDAFVSLGSDEIDVWFLNPNTGGIFGFGLPLPEAIAAQVRAGTLIACAGPDSHGLPPSFVLEAAGTDDDGTGEDEAILHPCLECGDTAARVDGEWLEHCATHAPKTVKVPTQRKAR